MSPDDFIELAMQNGMGKTAAVEFLASELGLTPNAVWRWMMKLNYPRTPTLKMIDVIAKRFKPS